MEQVQNKLSFIYDLNQEEHIVSLNFMIDQRKMSFKCSCAKRRFCYHIEYILECIYNSYFHDYDSEQLSLKIYQNENKLWLPVCETEDDVETIIHPEIYFISNKFLYYCSYCGGIHPVEKCSHFDYILKELMEHYHNLKDEDEDIDNIDLSSMNIMIDKTENMEIDD